MTVADTGGKRSRGVALAPGFLAGAIAVLTFHQGTIAYRMLMCRPANA